MENNNLNLSEVYLALNGAALTLQLIIEGMEHDLDVINEHPTASGKFVDRTQAVYAPLLNSVFSALFDLSDKVSGAA